MFLFLSDAWDEIIDFDDIAVDMDLSDIIGEASTPTHEFEEPFSTVFEANFQLNDFVSVNNKKRGNLRYLGKVHFKTGIFGGIELINAEGKHDGQLEGVR